MNNRFSLLLAALSLAASSAWADITVTSITWDSVGLDHNRPVTSGPELFPVGAQVCSSDDIQDVTVEMIWEDGLDPVTGHPYINTRPGSLIELEFDEILAGECVDAYFEIRLNRSSSAFGQSREYRIEATDGNVSASTPSNRQIYIERLVSQNRNSTQLIRYGQESDGSDWVALGAGGGLNLAVGETYFIELTTQTATAYEQLQSFLTLSNTIFRIREVETTYSVLTAPPSRVPVPNPRLWADGCLWESDITSPNYRSCLSTGKAGGVVLTVYEIEIISGGGETVGLEALIYDKSGGSFHYNTDFSKSPGDGNIFNPADSGFSKRFLPSTTSIGGASRLAFTITNPNPVTLIDYNFIDNLPTGVEVADPANASTSCGGTWDPQPEDVTLEFSGGVIGAFGSCSILVDVTADEEGEYDNVSENLFVGDKDTGNNAEATLNVTDGPLPPACVPDTELARWTMDPSQGTSVPPAPFVVHPDVDTAAASFTPLSTLPGVQTISTTDGNPVNSWQGTGWGTATTPEAAGPGPNDPSYFQFEIDTGAFSSDPTEPIDISIDVAPSPTGNWATPGNITANVHASVDGGPFSTIINANPVERGEWTTLTGQVPAGADNVVFRVNISGRSQGNANATFRIDNIIFTGCGPGDPADILDVPTLEKAFVPDTIGVDQTSTLTFVLDNPNTSGPLTGVTFDDELPPGMSVADPANAATTCDGTPDWNPQPEDTVLEFSDGVIPADSSCTVSVDVTSSSIGVNTNISGFIFAAESGQNAGPDGSAEANLNVLAPPVIAKDFDPELLLLGTEPPDLSLLTFVITNPNPADPIGGVAFEDELPAGLEVGDPAVELDELAVFKELVGQSDDPVELETILTYEITVTNLEEMLLTGVVVSDALVSIDQDDDCTWPDQSQIGVLDEFESVTCEIEYEVTAADLDEGAVLNLASAVSDQTDDAEALYLLRTPIVDSGCGLPVFDPMPGDSVISFSDGSIAAGGSCTVSVWVSGPEGVYDNLSDPVTHQVGGVEAEGNQAEATLVIDQPIPEITMAKQVGPSDDPEGVWVDYLAIAEGEPLYYRLIIENTGETVLTDILVDDDDVDTSSCPWEVDPDFSLPVADVSDPEAHFSVCIIGPITAVEGVTVNTALAAAVGNGQIVEDDDSATYATSELTLDKTADPLVFEQAGDVIEYTFTVENTGAAILAGPVEIDDDLIDEVDCPPLNTIGNEDNFFDPGEVIECTASYTITSSDVDAGFVTNVAFAFTPEAVSNIDDATVTLPIPDVSVSKSAVPGSGSTVNAGDTITYTVEVEIGETALTEVLELTDTLSPGLSLGTVTAGDFACNDDNPLICTLPLGTAPGSYILTYTATVDAGASGTLDNSVVITEDGGDPDADCDPCSTNHPLSDPDVSVVKSADPVSGEVVSPGQTLSYSLTVTVSDAATTDDVVLVDTLGAGLTVDSVPAGCSVSGQEITCTLSSGAVPDTYTFEYTATVDSDATVSVGNSVVIDESGGDPDPACPECETEHPVTASSVTVTKSADPASGEAVTAGQLIEYTLTVDVSDSATSDDVVLTDTLGAGLTLDAGTLPGSCTEGPDNVVTCTLDSGSVPDTYTFVYSATVDADAVGSVGNSVLAAGDDEPECEACETEHPVVMASLSLTKVISQAPDPIVEGSVLQYTITATNTGDVDLSNVVIVDDMITPSSETCPTVAPGETCILTGTYSVVQADMIAGEIINTATANGDDPQGNPVPEETAVEVTFVMDEPKPVPVGGPIALFLLLSGMLILGLGSLRRRNRPFGQG